MPFDTPIAFFLFNRPQETARTFDRVAQMKPRTLLIVADGPRGEGERQRCDDARAVLCRIDWPCDVRINFAESNMGCRRRVAGGLDWVFSHVDRAIVVEDDCLADLSFFGFCEELLARYRDERRVMTIAGANFQFGRRRSQDSYYFSKIPHIWGWATWRRAWQSFDLTMHHWPAARQTSWLRELVGHESAACFYRDMFDRGHREEVDTWDIQWVYSCFMRRGLTIIPQTNLVSNIGFGADATHTRASAAPEADMPVEPMAFPLRHPETLAVCTEADDFTLANSFNLKLDQFKSRAA